MLWAYTEWFPKLILPHLYQKAAGRAEQQQPVAVRDPYRAQNRAKPCSLLSPATQDIHAQSTAHGTQCWPPKCPIQLVTHSHPRTLWHPLPLEKHSRCCLTPGHLWLPQAHSKLWVALQEGFDPSCSRSHGKLHLSGKTLGQITAAHTRWGDTMHS